MSENFETAHFFQKMFDAVPIAMILVEQNGNIQFVNRYTEQLFGYTTQNLVGQPVEVLLPERHREEHPKYRDRYMKLPKMREMGQGRKLFALRIDGSEFPVEISIAPVRTETGFYILASVVDISERMLVQEQLSAEEQNKLDLENKKKQLEMANEQLAEFSHIVSHDLNDPFQKIEYFFDVIARRIDQTDDELAQATKSIQNSVKKGKELISALLTYAQSSSIQLTTLNLNTIVRDIIKGYSYNSGIEFKFTGTLPEKFQADATLMKQLFINLIDNAVKYHPKDRQNVVEIKADKSGVFSIGDNGIGISEENQPNLFRPFFRAHPKEIYPGSGLGLSICKKIVERHGGKIWIRSKEGEGTTVMFTLGEPEGPKA